MLRRDNVGRRNDLLADTGRYSWMTILSGILLVIWGIYAIAAPGVGLLTLGMYFGVTALLSGLVMLVAGFRHRHDTGAFALILVESILLCAVGLVLLANPVATAVSIPTVVGLWAVIAGIIQCVQAFNLRPRVRNWWGSLLTGLASIVVGWLIMSRPIAGAVTVAWLMGAAAIAVGAFRLVLGSQIQSLRRAVSGLAPGAFEEEPPSRRAA